MNIENALKIEGWINPEDLEWLARQAETHQAIIEVGCWLGRSTLALADNTSGFVIPIDHWKGSEEHQSSMIGKQEDWLYAEFLKNVNRELGHKIRPLRMSSLGAAKYLSDMAVMGFENLKFDMVFIDASHDYESVKSDILAWRTLVRGLLCGHDSGHPPVERAVKELLPNARFEQAFWAVEIP